MVNIRKSFLKKVKETNYRNYPIKNKQLEDETDYIKNHYFRYLALVLQQTEDASGEARTLLSRMLEGAHMEGDIIEYTRQALEVTVEEYIEFMDQLREKPLRYRFLLDTILLGCCTSADEETLDLIAAYMESLRISKEEAGYLSDMGKSILQRDSELYWCTLLDSGVGIPVSITDEYSSTYVCDRISCENNVLEICFAEKTELDLKKILSENQKNFMKKGALSLASPNCKQTYKKFSESDILDDVGDIDDFIDDDEAETSILAGWDRIIIRNALIDLSNNRLLLAMCKNAEFSSCRFYGGEEDMDVSIALFQTDIIAFIDCQFEEFANYVIVVLGTAEVRISSSGFRNCYLEVDNDEKGLIVCGVNEGANSVVLIEDTHFENCCVGAEEAQLIISNCKCKVQNSYFERCWGYDDPSEEEMQELIADDELEDVLEEETLFPRGSVNRNNVIENSARFA